MFIRVIVSKLLFGDRIIVPEEFCPLSEDASLSHQTFQLSAISNNKVTKTIPCGVLEYSARKGEIIVSEEIQQSLNIADMDLVQLEPVLLPKATSVTFKLKKPIHQSIAVERVLINRILEKYSCIYKDQLLSFVWENESIQCFVSDLLPNRFCSLIDADVGVSLHTVHIQEEPEYTCYELSEEQQCLQVELCEHTQLMVSLKEDPFSYFHLKGSNLCCIAYMGFYPYEETYNEKAPISAMCHKRSYFVENELFIPVSSAVQFWIEVYSGHAMEMSIMDTVDSPTKKENGLSNQSSNETLCPNCHRCIPASSYQLHTAYCQRHIIQCPICNQPVHKQQQFAHQHCSECGFVTSRDHLPFHQLYEHTPKQCTCGLFVTPSCQGNHYQLDCPKRLVSCRFCHESHYRDSSLGGNHQDPVDRFEGLTVHESVCANKTVSCNLCQEYVMERYLIQHYHLDHHLPIIPNHFILCNLCGFRQNCVVDFCLKCNAPLCSDDLVKITECSNLECRKRGIEKSAISTGLCPSCYRSIYTNHQNTVKQIIPFVSHCYLQQFKTGCGSSHCHNPFCKSFCGTLEREMPQEFQSVSRTPMTHEEMIHNAIQLTKLSLKCNFFWICPSIFPS